MRVFLGGTMGNPWRQQLINMLDVDYFDPTVDNWTQEHQVNESKERARCTHLLYVLTSEMQGVYTVAEVVDDSNKRSARTILCVLPDGFTDHQLKSLEAVKAMVRGNGSVVLDTIDAVANYLNQAASRLTKEQVAGMVYRANK